MNWKITGLSALLTAVVTVALSVIYYPLLFLGPLLGGFACSYLNRSYEDYSKLDRKDGAVLGAFSGIMGGLLTGLVFILGVGSVMELVSSPLGGVTGSTILTWYIVLQLVLIVSILLGVVGGVLGVLVKEN